MQVLEPRKALAARTRPIEHLMFFAKNMVDRENSYIKQLLIIIITYTKFNVCN